MAIGEWRIESDYENIPKIDEESGEVYDSPICSDESYTISLSGLNSSVSSTFMRLDRNECTDCVIAGIFIENSDGTANVAGNNNGNVPNNLITRKVDCQSVLKRGDDAVNNEDFIFSNVIDFKKYRVNSNNITNNSSYSGNRSYSNNYGKIDIVLPEEYTPTTGKYHSIEYGISGTVVNSTTIQETPNIIQLGIGGCVTVIDSSAFNGNSHLRYIHLVGSNLQTIGSNAFQYIGSSVNEGVTIEYYNSEDHPYTTLHNLRVIGSNAFQNINGLIIKGYYTQYTGIDLSSAYGLSTIGQAAFASSTPPLGFSQYVINLSGCTSLTAINENTFAAMNGGYLCNVQCGKYDGFAIILPSSITTIHATAFLNTYIDNLTLLSNSPVTISGGIPQNWHIKILHVKSDLESHYNSIKTQWGVFNVIGDE